MSEIERCIIKVIQAANARFNDPASIEAYREALERLRAAQKSSQS